MADRRSAVSVRVPGRLADVHPLPVEQVVGHLPAAQAQRNDLRTPLRREEGPQAAPELAPLRGRTRRARSQHLELGIEIATQGGVVGDRDAVRGGRPTESPSPRVMAMESPTISSRTGLGPVGPRALQRGVLGARETGRERDEPAGSRRTSRRGRPARHPPAPGRAARGTPTRGRRRPAGPAPPIPSPHHRPPRRGPPAPGRARAARPGRIPGTGRRARLLGVGASRDSLERPGARHGRPAAAPTTQAGTSRLATTRAKPPVDLPTHESSVSPRTARGPEAPAGRRSTPRPRPRCWAGGPGRPS